MLLNDSTNSKYNRNCYLTIMLKSANIFGFFLMASLIMLSVSAALGLVT